MIRYKYNLIVDIQKQVEALRIRRWLRENNVTYIPPNPWETLKLICNRPKIDYQCEDDIDCYWISGGNGGSYYLPNRITVCPREKSHTVEEIIKHEITHLKHESEVQDMTHQEKEAYIIGHEKSAK